MRHLTLEHRFVRNAPRVLEPGVLYISMEYATAVHSCCCGCGDRVVTPFTPTDWRMTFDGESVTLNPSVGNWNQACRSHYVIDKNRVIEYGPWSDARVEIEKRRDKQAKAEYYGCTPGLARHDSLSTAPAGYTAQTSGLWSRFQGWFSK
ncbi:DUF6527 family protein [Delftia lacustris]|uniref:Uncharacterized protein n=1 Tax=Delftia lacustris TaxID=558537 RepID=A0A1H3UJY3_9BURK|nr:MULTISPECIES: DUF6527 family protein [Delftia]SDZ62331.1 hypothetical protein SAMN05421547_1488 [Delftia lacustris]